MWFIKRVPVGLLSYSKQYSMVVLKLSTVKMTKRRNNLSFVLRGSFSIDKSVRSVYTFSISPPGVI